MQQQDLHILPIPKKRKKKKKEDNTIDEIHIHPWTSKLIAETGFSMTLFNCMSFYFEPREY